MKSLFARMLLFPHGGMDGLPMQIIRQMYMEDKTKFSCLRTG